MTIENFYALTGGDYADTKLRFLTDDRILRFVGKFPSDESFSLLKSSLAENNAETAFRAAHTLKGVASNLGFTSLFKVSSEITEVLRGGNTVAEEQFAELEKIYVLIIEHIKDLQA